MMVKPRFSLRAELLEPVELFENIELRSGNGDYRHVELEGEEVGIIFERDGYELRVIGVHRPLADFAGAIGLQVKDELFAAIGEEAFIPSNDMTNYGVFLVEHLNTEWGAWEFGGRLESVKVDPLDADLTDRSFTTGTASAGFVRKLGEAGSVSSNLTCAERAPNASELYAFGLHIGTQSFESGNAAFGKESSLNLDLSFRRSAGFVISQCWDWTYISNGLGGSCI